jgi:hypothetical protein
MGVDFLLNVARRRSHLHCRLPSRRTGADARLPHGDDGVGEGLDEDTTVVERLTEGVGGGRVPDQRATLVLLAADPP